MAPEGWCSGFLLCLTGRWCPGWRNGGSAAAPLGPAALCWSVSLHFLSWWFPKLGSCSFHFPSSCSLFFCHFLSNPHLTNTYKQSFYKALCPQRAYCPKQIDARVFRHIPTCVVQSPGFLAHPAASGMPLRPLGPRPQVARLWLLVAPFSKAGCCVLTSRPFPLSWQCSVLDVGASLFGRVSHCHSLCHRRPATLFGRRGSGHVALPKWDSHLYQKPQELRPRRQ